MNFVGSNGSIQEPCLGRVLFCRTIQGDKNVLVTLGLDELATSLVPEPDELSDGCTSAWQLKHHMLKSLRCKHKGWLAS